MKLSEEKVYRFSELANKVKASMIRELLKYANLPGAISFGGGTPDPETFPREELAQLAAEVIQKEYKYTLQYATTEGDPELVKQIIHLIKRVYDVDGVEPENVLITAGSQQALELIGKVLLDKDDYVIVGDPEYLGALGAFRMRDPRFLVVRFEDDGPDINQVESYLKKLDASGQIHRLKFLYLVSNFQNPSGITTSLEKRKALVELAEKYDFLIVEDDPYGALRFEGEMLPPLLKFGGTQRVILLNTFSKILCPGLRIGVVVADKTIIRKLVLVKQSTDLCGPALNMRLTARYLERYDILQQIKPAIELYRRKRDVMLDALKEYFGDVPGAKWTKPEGGLFVWVTLPEGYDTMEMFKFAEERKVFYIPGQAFRPFDEPSSSMRMSFCLPPFEKIVEGVRKLKEAFLAYKAYKGLR